jgi:hypothetical protein
MAREMADCTQYTRREIGGERAELRVIGSAAVGRLVLCWSMVAALEA